MPVFIGFNKGRDRARWRAQHPWRPKLVYHYIQWKNIVPDFVVDITGFTDKKN
jgi:hypothetical protein